MIDAGTLEDMRAAGIPSDQIVEVAIAMLKRQEEAEAERLAKKRAAARERKAKSRKNKEAVTNVTVTECDARDKKESPPTPPKEKIYKNPPKGGQKAPLDEMAAEVWALWPKRGRERSSQKQVRAAYAGVLKAHEHLDVLSAIKRYLKTPDAMKEDGEYVPALHRWLRAERFTSHLEQAESPPDWPKFVKGCREFGFWTSTLGPKPGEPGCKAPAEIQREYGFEPQIGSAA